MTARAGAQFAAAAAKAGNLPIDLAKPGNSVLRISQLAESGGSMTKAARDFLKRVTDPDKPPLTYNEARDFYSNVSRLSADEFNRLTPVMQRAVGDFRASLGQAIQDTATAAGVGDEYSQAMHGYRTAARNRQWMENAGKLALKAAPSVVGTGAAGLGLYAAQGWLSDLLGK
jgi:hypothetical protein